MKEKRFCCVLDCDAAWKIQKRQHVSHITTSPDQTRQSAASYSDKTLYQCISPQPWSNSRFSPVSSWTVREIIWLYLWWRSFISTECVSVVEPTLSLCIWGFQRETTWLILIGRWAARTSECGSADLILVPIKYPDVICRLSRITKGHKVIVLDILYLCECSVCYKIKWVK